MLIDQPIPIGISACMYGCKVRYNAKGWDMLQNIGRESEPFVFYPVCPEIMSGMGIPRSSISIRGKSGDDVWRGEARVKNRKGEDRTEDLMRASEQALEILRKGDVKAYIYMEGSPSCGVYRTSLKNKRLGHPPGVFGSLLLREGFFLIPANDMQSPIKWWDWRRRLFAFLWLDDEPIEDKGQLYHVWHQLKFLVQEVDEPFARQLGKELAAMPKHIDEAYIKTFKSQVMNTLRKPSSVPKIKQRLWKHYVHYRDHYDLNLEIVKEPTDLRGMTALAQELVAVEKALYLKGKTFSSSPVIFRYNRKEDEDYEV